MLKKKVDSNQAQIIADLKKIGVSVLNLSRVGGGCPDILVGWQGKNILIEIKTAKGNLNDSQIEFFEQWKGPKFVCKSINEIIEIINNKKKLDDQ